MNFPLAPNRHGYIISSEAGRVLRRADMGAAAAALRSLLLPVDQNTGGQHLQPGRGGRKRSTGGQRLAAASCLLGNWTRIIAEHRQGLVAQRSPHSDRRSGSKQYAVLFEHNWAEDTCRAAPRKLCTLLGPSCIRKVPDWTASPFGQQLLAGRQRSSGVAVRSRWTGAPASIQQARRGACWRRPWRQRARCRSDASLQERGINRAPLQGLEGLPQAVHSRQQLIGDAQPRLHCDGKGVGVCPVSAGGQSGSSK
jgi:hypothetical protein